MEAARHATHGAVHCNLVGHVGAGDLAARIDVLHAAGGEIVQSPNLAPGREQGVDPMGSDEAGGASHEICSQFILRQRRGVSRPRPRRRDISAKSK
jgi:hypothetical protein